MMSDVTDELNEIGVALAAAGDGEPVELSDDQRATLSRASQADIVDALMSVPSIGGPIPDTLVPDVPEHLLSATCWAECINAFRNLETQELIDVALATDNPAEHLQRLVLSDTRLTGAEREPILAILDNVAHTSAHATSASKPPGSAYVASLAVSGFRGIGRRAQITFEVGPGLTVVYGANGSGKSSLAEGLEVLLTGKTARFDNRSHEWLRSWSNIHQPKSGEVEARFASSHRLGDTVYLQRSWSDNPIRASYDSGNRLSFGVPLYNYTVDPTETIRELGWSDAVTTFKPIFGYAEGESLLGETRDLSSDDGRIEYIDEPRRTTLGHNVAVRTGIADPLVNDLHHTLEELGGPVPIGEVLAALIAITRGGLPMRKFVSGSTLVLGPRIPDDERRLLTPLTSSEVNDGQRRSPKRWNWSAIADLYDNLSPGTQELLVRVARAYHDHVDFKMGQITRDYYDPPVDIDMNEHPFAGARHWRSHIYGYMMVDAIYRSRLHQFSRRSAKIWSTIRSGSAVQFSGIDLSLISPGGLTDTPVTRVSLHLSAGNISGVERGVLSQGELHTLALSTFLPTMTRSESPFGFAVIDDPVQAMDEHAVHGLAAVLEEYAETLQLIVFTHDKRLIEALRNQDIDHALINVTRADHSQIECEPLYNPVTQRLFDARQEAERRRGRGRLTHLQDVADHCRRAIEAACMRARRKTLLSEGKAGVEIKDAMDDALAGRDITTRGLMALAIFGDFDRHSDVRKHVAEDEHDKWGQWVDTTLRRVNDVVHAKTAREAREALGSDLYTLINDVERLTQKIKENCSGPDHRDA